MTRVASAPFSSGIDRSIDHHVGKHLLGQAHRLAAVAGDGEYLHVGLRFDDVLQAFGHHRVVIGDQDAIMRDARLRPRWCLSPAK